MNRRNLLKSTVLSFFAPLFNCGSSWAKKDDACKLIPDNFPGGVILVMGASGMGKTLLASELSRLTPAIVVDDELINGVKSRSLLNQHQKTLILTAQMSKQGYATCHKNRWAKPGDVYKLDVKRLVRKQHNNMKGD